MAVPSQFEDAPEAGDAAFLEQAHLTYLIPSGTDVDIKADIENAIAQKKPLGDIDTRSFLFFGMHQLCLRHSTGALVSHNTHS